jgi:flagellar hook-associated protein 1 FlgK
MGMSGLNIAVSGLSAAQAGLYVTGHNMANSQAEGFSRQRPVQADFLYTTVSDRPQGKLQKGLGTQLKAIQQIRSRFLDAAYRLENTRLGFYEIKSGAGTEVENIIGETQSQYNFQSVITDMWDSLNEMASHPEGLETRANFVATSVAFITKANDVYNRLFEYQHNLNNQIKDAVANVNSLLTQIDTLNRKITDNEANGDHANDYRDERSVCLDQLCKIIKADIREKPDGSVNITAEGQELLSNGRRSNLGLIYTSDEYSFVDPVFTDSAEILPSNTPTNQYRRLFKFNEPVNADYGNDNGSLKAMLLARGTRPGNYLGELAVTKPEDIYSVNNCFIPQVMVQIDAIVHGIVTMINDTFAPADITGTQDPNAPFDLDGGRYTEIFVRNTMDRWNGDQLIPEANDNYYSQYTIGNMEVNPLLTRSGGYNKIAMAQTPVDRDDNQLLLGLIEKWNAPVLDLGGAEPLSIDSAYQNFISFIGDDTSENLNFVEEQTLLTQQTDDKRGQIMGVSLDEEMKNMMIYQHAYSAAARILNVLDSMLDRVINGLGA